MLCLLLLGRDSSLFETIQVLNQKKIPSDFDRLTDEEDPRKHLPVPLQSLIASSGQPANHPLTPSQTVISTISSSSSSSSNPIDNVDDDLLPTHLGKEFSDRNYGDNSTTGIGNNNHSLLLNGNDGIDDDNDEVADFDVDSFTNQLLERCEVLLQDYRARKEPASNDIAKGKMMPTTTTTTTTTTNTTTTTRALASERSHHINNNGDGDSNDDVVISNSKNPAAAVVDVQTSTRRQAATAMDVGIQTVSVSSSGTQLKKSSVSVGVGVGGDVDGDVSGVRVDHSSNTLGTASEGSGLLYLSSSSEDGEDVDDDVDEDDDVYCYDGGQKEVYDTVAQDGSTPLSLEAFEKHDAKAIASQAVGIAVRYPDLPVPDRKEHKIGIHAKQSESLSSPLPAANEVRAAFEVPPPPPPPPPPGGGGLNDVDVDDVVVDLQYVQPYLHDDHVQELWRRLGEVEAALHLRGAVTVDSNRVSTVTGITTASSSQKAQYIQRRYY